MGYRGAARTVPRYPRSQARSHAGLPGCGPSPHPAPLELAMPTNSVGGASSLRAGNADYRIFGLRSLEEKGVGKISRLPFTTKILLENLLRQEDGRRVAAADIEYVARGASGSAAAKEISFMPARVLLQD